ncbi:HAD hydrolase-like protein [Flavobacteriaceae bacterium TP-CH-4]|uniref:HAD hydrolase-like protein n=1 Tax=Pelagihabitans pacificus TaxID=2696054 RepID=A0A967E589_9FLAO|nr:HAD hydrolase-like protein [Pelagihabitans pacificus]NHF59192.1 HAD hydrolase-like protein [Pelagihabitans pacificus]
MTLFIDMDEVIADTYMAHIEIYNKDFDGSLTVEECMGKEVWQCVPEEHQKSVRDHAKQEGFFINLKPIKDSKEVLQALHEKYALFIASAAMQFPNSLREKSQWLDEHFPFIHWKNRILCGNKHILKGDLLIDDRSYNLDSFDGDTLLFTSPHNIHSNGHPRAKNWLEVADKLL